MMPSSQVMHKFKKGTLRSSSGQLVTNRQQALAILESERRNEAEHGGTYQSSTDRQNTPVRKARRRRK
jgi:hypothetical protein